MRASVDDLLSTPWWSIDNPQTVGAAAFNPEPVVAPLELWLVPDSVPEPDPTVQYPGQGAKALWDDVWHYSKSILSYFGRSGPSVAYVTTDVLNQAIDDTLRSSVNSLSGFINQSAQLAVDAQNWASKQLDALDANIGAIYQYFDDRIKFLDAYVSSIVSDSLPALQHGLDLLRHDMLAGFAFNSAADRQWATDHIFRPLQEDIFREALRANAAIDESANAVRSYVDAHDIAQSLHFASLVAPLAVAVKALQTESEQCTQPLCEVLGPKTDLGKLLKGLKVATELAALTALLNMNEQDLANVITQVTGRLGAIVGDFEQFFAPGGETVAGLIKAAGGSVI